MIIFIVSLWIKFLDMAAEPLNGRQRTIINNLIHELEDLKRRDDVNNISNSIAIKRTCNRLENENVISFSQALDLEIYLFGLLKLLKDSK